MYCVGGLIANCLPYILSASLQVAFTNSERAGMHQTSVTAAMNGNGDSKIDDDNDIDLDDI